MAVLYDDREEQCCYTDKPDPCARCQWLWMLEYGKKIKKNCIYIFVKTDSNDGHIMCITPRNPDLDQWRDKFNNQLPRK